MLLEEALGGVKYFTHPRYLDSSSLVFKPFNLSEYWKYRLCDGALLLTSCFLFQTIVVGDFNILSAPGKTAHVPDRLNE